MNIISNKKPVKDKVIMNSDLNSVEKVIGVNSP